MKLAISTTFNPEKMLSLFIVLSFVSVMISSFRTNAVSFQSFFPVLFRCRLLSLHLKLEQLVRGIACMSFFQFLQQQ